MIKINLLAERKPIRAKAPSRFRLKAFDGTQNLQLVGILLVGAVTSGVWWWSRSSELEVWKDKHRKADAELARLAEIRKQGEEYKTKKEQLENRIRLITELKKKQTVPVNIMDQISKNLPDFLWLSSMTAIQNQITITGKATTYNAVSNFYDNLNASGYFTAVDLGRTSQIPEGVSFSLVCRFNVREPEAGQAEQAEPVEEAEG